jgi:hypothetical protein
VLDEEVAVDVLDEGGVDVLNEDGAEVELLDEDVVGAEIRSNPVRKLTPTTKAINSRAAITIRVFLCSEDYLLSFEP